MEILLINASPKGEKSNTLHITEAFLSGLNKNKKNHIKRFQLVDKNIGYCRGCFGCWNHESGKCVIRDDMDDFMEKYINAELIIWNTPIYVFGFPAIGKNIFDRMLPLHEATIMQRKEGKGEQHLYRYGMEQKKHILIATCGFYSYENNVEPIIKQFDIMYGNQYEKIICPEGTLFRLSVFDYKTKEYLQAAKKAGIEYSDTGEFSEETKEALTKRTFGVDHYLTLANNYWTPRHKDMSEKEYNNMLAQKHMKQVSVIFIPNTFDEEEAVLEFYFTDAEYRCQLLLSKNGCKIIEDFDQWSEYHLKITTTIEKFHTMASQNKSALQTKVSNGSSFQNLAERVLILKRKNLKREMRI